MVILRVLVLLIFAVFLAGCAQHIPVLATQDDVSTTTAQPDRTLTAKVKSEAEKPKPTPPKPTVASTTRHEDKIDSTTPMVGSPQKWEKERAEDERKEQRLKQVIEGICRGC
jgi:PBP1b-binding outer membrane lipoprotein LpoB